MSRVRTWSAQLFALVGLLVLGLALARTFDLGLAYEQMRAGGDGYQFATLLGLVGLLYLPLAGALLLGALVLSLPHGARLPRIRARLTGSLAVLLAFVVLVVIAARSVGADLSIPAPSEDVATILGFDLVLALPVACLVAMLATSGIVLWRSGARES